MKKLTKTAIKNAANYMVIIDQMTNSRLDALVLEATNLIEAMDEATGYFNAGTYMLSIVEKTEETIESNGLVYREILRSRSEGRWATMNASNLIEGTTWVRYFYKDGSDSAHILTCSR